MKELPLSLQADCGKAETNKKKKFLQRSADSRYGDTIVFQGQFFWKNKGKIRDMGSETVYRVLPFIVNCKPALGQKVCTHGGGRLNMNKFPFSH